MNGYNAVVVVPGSSLLLLRTDLPRRESIPKVSFSTPRSELRFASLPMNISRECVKEERN